MKYQALEKYLHRLSESTGPVQAQSRVWLDAEGRALGKYFNTTLTSAFQPIRVFGDSVVADARDALALLAQVKPDLLSMRENLPTHKVRRSCCD